MAYRPPAPFQGSGVHGLLWGWLDSGDFILVGAGEVAEVGLRTLGLTAAVLRSDSRRTASGLV